MNPDGSNLERIFSTEDSYDDVGTTIIGGESAPILDHLPEWSPDGNYLLFVTRTDYDYRQLYLYDHRNKSVNEILNIDSPILGFGWAPSSDYFYYDYFSETDHELYIVDVHDQENIRKMPIGNYIEGFGIIEMITNEHFVVFDSAFLGPGRFLVINSDFEITRHLTGEISEKILWTYIESIQWIHYFEKILSPNGESIYFQQCGPDFFTRYFTCHLHKWDFDIYESDMIMFDGKHVYHSIDISKSNDRVVVAICPLENLYLWTKSCNINVYDNIENRRNRFKDLGESVLRDKNSANYPAWSPDGNHFIFEYSVVSNYKLQESKFYLSSWDGTEIKEIPIDLKYVGPPVWSHEDSFEALAQSLEILLTVPPPTLTPSPTLSPTITDTPVISSTPPGPVIFDDFSDPDQGGWSSPPWEGREAYYENGGYILEILKDKKAFLANHDGQAYSSIKIDVDMKFIEGFENEVNAGVVCKYNFLLPGNYYYVSIKPNGKYAIVRQYKEANAKFLSGDSFIFHPSIRQGIDVFNHLTVECDNEGKIRLFVNDEFVTEVVDFDNDDALFGLVGLWAGAVEAPLKVFYDNFEANEIP